MISPYIESIRDWKICEMIAGFIQAKTMYEEHYTRQAENSFVSFDILRILCDFLYEAKEDHHQIFNRIINPKEKEFEDASKFTPDDTEINFMNSVGLLFHKMMVARELTYMLDYYTEDSTGYQETKNSVDRNLQRIGMLFKQGIEVLLSMLRSPNQQDNVHLITYFIENSEVCESQFHMSLDEILGIVTGDRGIDYAYLKSAKYYADSGWPEKVKNSCNVILAHQPNNKDAKKLLASLS